MSIKHTRTQKPKLKQTFQGTGVAIVPRFFVQIVKSYRIRAARAAVASKQLPKFQFAEKCFCQKYKARAMNPPSWCSIVKHACSTFNATPQS